MNIIVIVSFEGSTEKVKIFIILIILRTIRVLATVKNSMVNAVFPIWPMVQLPNLFPKYLTEYQNVKIGKSKFKSEKSKKNKYKSNVVLKGNKKERD